jgi:hypothetical protein
MEKLMSDAVSCLSAYHGKPRGEYKEVEGINSQLRALSEMGMSSDEREMYTATDQLLSVRSCK